MDKRLKKRLIIFDLDGTLVDSSPDIVWAANRTFEDMGLPEREAEEIKAAIGWGVKMLFEGLLAGEAASLIERARSVFIEHYKTHLVVDTVLYDGVMETLELFKGRKMAVVTNKPTALALGVLQGLGLEGRFDPVYGGDSFERRKPHPMPLIKAMEAVGVSKEETVFVGDSRVDIETGRAAGVATIGAVYGFRGREELVESGADFFIDSFSELKGLIE